MRSAILGFLVMCCISCASFNAGKDKLARIYLTDTAGFTLLPPAEIEKTFDGIQQITGEYQDDAFIMESYVLANSDTITMSLYNSMGVEIAAINFDGKNVMVISSYFPKNLRGEYIIADFQLVFYNYKTLARALKKIGLSLEVTFDGVKEQRRVLSRNGIVISIIKTADKVEYVNHLRHYSYTLWGNFSD